MAKRSRVSKKKSIKWDGRFKRNVLEETVNEVLKRQALCIELTRDSIENGVSIPKSFNGEACQTYYIQGPKHPAPPKVAPKVENTVGYAAGIEVAERYLLSALSLWQLLKYRWKYLRRTNG